jgi:ABC-type polysaccharide/polyol phosphate transport system ATPase subunit
MIKDFAIELDNVCFQYPSITNKFLKNKFVESFTTRTKPDPEPAYVLKNINLSIKPGERLGVIGGNGSGKSTLLKILSKIYTPTSGKIRCIGKVAPILDLGGGFQPDFTGRENIHLNCSILGLKQKQINDLESEIIEFSGLGAAIDLPVRTFSSGMYVRLAFSIATSIDPEILIIDEVMSAGDIDFALKAKNRMTNLINSASTLILVSHDHRQIEDYTDRAIFVNEGRIQADGPSRETISQYHESLRT